jgi:hypothetical protein
MIDDFKTVDDRNESLHGPTKEQAARQKITREADFHTPEQIAASGPDPVDEAAPKKPITSKRRFVLTWPPSKKTLIIGIVIILVIVGGVTAWALTLKTCVPGNTRFYSQDCRHCANNRCFRSQRPSGQSERQWDTRYGGHD